MTVALPTLAGAGSDFLTLDQLMARCGTYCWVEHRLFALTGQWASDEGDPECRVLFSTMSRQHALVASQWRDRLPVRAGIDPEALVVPPAGPMGPALDVLEAQTDVFLRLAGLVEVVLPRLRATYGEHLARASAVRQAPVMAVLRYARLVGAAEISSGHALVQYRLQQGERAEERAEIWAEFGPELQRPFGSVAGIFPVARAS